MKLIYKQKVEDIIAAFALKVKRANIAQHLVQKRESNSELSWNIMVCNLLYRIVLLFPSIFNTLLFILQVQANVMQSQNNDLLKKMQQKNPHKLYKDTVR